MKRIATFLLLLLTGGALFGASSHDSALLQELRLSLEQLSRQVHSQSVEINLFQERALSLENSVKNLKQEHRTGSSDRGVEKRIGTIEKSQEAMVTDLKSLKNHLNETNRSITECQSQLTKIDKQLTSDIHALKGSIQSMLALLQGEGKSYIVQNGDSLGQIALNHKTDIKTLKKLNNLSTDKIYSGQKLILP